MSLSPSDHDGFDPFGFEAPCVTYTNDKSLNVAIGEKRKDQNNSGRTPEKIPPPPAFGVSSCNQSAEFDMFSSPKGQKVVDFSLQNPAEEASQTSFSFSAFDAVLGSPSKLPSTSFASYQAPTQTQLPGLPGYPQGSSVPPSVYVPSTSGNPFDMARGVSGGNPFAGAMSVPPSGPYMYPQGVPYYPHGMPYYPPQGPGSGSLPLLGHNHGPGSAPHLYHQPIFNPHTGQWMPPANPYPQGPAVQPLQTLHDPFSSVGGLGWRQAGKPTVTTPSSVTYVPQSPGKFQESNINQRVHQRGSSAQIVLPPVEPTPVVESLNPFDMY